MQRKVAGLLIFMFVGVTAFADVPALPVSAPEKVSLSSLIQEALKNNPRLKAAQYRAEAAKARVGLFRNIPDPMLEYEYDRITPAASMTAGDKVRPMKSLAVSQEIPFHTKIFMRKKSAQKEASALEQEYNETERQEAYLNVIFQMYEKS